jgi:hypothetical protein
VRAVPWHHRLAYPAVAEGAGMKKALGWILLVLILFYIGTQPAEAADIARGLGNGIMEVFRNIGTFVRELTT